LIEVPSMATQRQRLVLLRCAGCESGFYNPSATTAFTDHGDQSEGFWRHYVQVGGGVWETIWPVLVARPGRPGRLLDVGCGFGFLVDYWRRAVGGEAVGVELADYGAIGARFLDVPVFRESLEQCVELADQQFDIVYSSEVIEHVPNPTAYVKLLARFVAPAGVLVLTTPCMDYVAPRNSSPTLLAALAPGFHGFLLSPRAFHDTARAAGFARVEVRRFGERQMLWASRVPRTLDFAVEQWRAEFLAYLEDWFERGDRSTPLWQGYAYRLVRDLTNSRRYAPARARADELVAALEADFGTDIRNPDAMGKKVGVCSTLTELGRMAPYFLPNLYFSLASIAQHFDQARRTARALYGGAADLSVAFARVHSTALLEASSLVWNARLREAWLLLEDGDVRGAAVAFVRFARQGRDPRPATGYAAVGDEEYETQIQGACQELARQGAWLEASGVFAAYLDELAGRRPQRDFTAPQTVAALVGEAPPRGILDVVFPLFFQGLLDAAIPRTPNSHGRLQALLTLAAQHGSNSDHGARLLQYAGVVRQLFPQLTGSPPPANARLTGGLARSP
jgi:SAM-dependent methyltransferase